MQDDAENSSGPIGRVPPPIPEAAERGAGSAGAVRVAAATLLFALVHSAFASRQAKQAAAQLFGERNRNGLYRPFYLAQTAVSLAAFWAYACRQPDRELYRIEGPFAVAMRAGQLTALGYTLWAASAVGLGEISGLKNLAAWLAGDEEAPPEPEAQGPAAAANGRLRIRGPFRWSRHPLNFAPVPLLWLSPRMTARWAAFNTVATLYFIVGSLHEEARLQEVHGEWYAAYRESGCPFFVPGAGHQDAREQETGMRSGSG